MRKVRPIETNEFPRAGKRWLETPKKKETKTRDSLICAIDADPVKLEKEGRPPLQLSWPEIDRTYRRQKEKNEGEKNEKRMSRYQMENSRKRVLSRGAKKKKRKKDQLFL